MSDDMMTFEEPPRPAYGFGSSPYPLEEWARALRARPGEWARLEHPALDSDTKRKSMAINISQGRARVFRPAGSFRTRTVKINDEVRVYAKFVGETS